jgi:integrase/recombinase XerD
MLQTKGGENLGNMWSYLDDFKNETLKSRSKLSVNAYISDLKEFLDEDFDTMTTEKISEYQNNLLTKGLKAKTVNRKLLSLRKYIKFVNICNEVTKIDVDIKLFKVQRKQNLKNLLAYHDFERLVRAAENDKRALAIFHALYYTGVRVSELLTFSVDIIDKNSVEVLGKGNKYRSVYFSEKLVKYIRDYIDERKHKLNSKLFINKNNDNPMDRQAIHKIIKFYAGESKINKRKAHAHNFRHLFATNMLKEKVSIEQLADILGHTDINITRIYLDFTENEIRETVNRL